MSETEITVQVFNDVGEIKAILLKNGFNYSHSFLLRDYYFSAFDIEELKTFSYRELMKSSLLLRQVDDSENCQVIYKDKEIAPNGVVLAEEKRIIDKGRKNELLERLKSKNYRIWCIIENESDLYTNGEKEFVLQKVKGLGNFIEVEEYPAISNLSPVEKINELSSFVRSFGLELGDDLSVKKPYLFLLQKSSY